MACSSGPDTPDRPAAPGDPRARVVAAALELISAPYRMNTAGPAAFDDTGLAAFAYRQADLALPASVQDQLAAGTPIDLTDARPADLLFYRIKDASGRTRLVVGLYTRPGEMILASPGLDGTQGVALFDTTADYWRQRLVAVIPVLE